MRVEIKRIHHLPGEGKTKAFADIILDGANVIIKGCRVVEGSNGLFVSLPQRTYDKDGETKYAPIVSMPVRDQLDVVMKSVIDAYNGNVAGPVDTPQPEPEAGAGSGEGPEPGPGGDAIFDGPDGDDSVPF